MRRSVFAFLLLALSAGRVVGRTSHPRLVPLARRNISLDIHAFFITTQRSKSKLRALTRLKSEQSITIPHAMTAQRWDVFNSGTGNVSLVCDSGTINGQSSISVTSQTGKTVTTDGTNCFAH